jgi:hypothetical protein
VAQFVRDTKADSLAQKILLEWLRHGRPAIARSAVNDHTETVIWERDESCLTPARLGSEIEFEDVGPRGSCE